MEEPIPFEILAIFAGVLVFLFASNRLYAHRVRKNLAQLAQTLGLPPPAEGLIASMSTPQISGVIRGREVRIFTYKNRFNSKYRSWCAVTMVVRNPGQLTLSVSGENVLTRIGRVFGVDDVATGDTGFDAQFYLKSSDPGYIQAALSPKVREQMALLWSVKGLSSISLAGNQLKYAESNSFSEPSACTRFGAVVELLQAIGDIVEARR